MSQHVLVIDNYDSFTYNLVQYVETLGARCEVHLNDRVDVADVERAKPDGILISPGPGTPDDAGVSLPVLERLGARIPVLGVCLGHQSIAQRYGGKVVRAERLMHGKTSEILHRGTSVFRGLPSPLVATRYHSLIADRASLPDCLEITAETAEGEIMGLAHREHPVTGVQFHPESILTEHGLELLRNWLDAL